MLAGGCQWVAIRVLHGLPLRNADTLGRDYHAPEWGVQKPSGEYVESGLERLKPSDRSRTQLHPEGAWVRANPEF